MKRGPRRAWPKDIVEVPSTREDPRADPQATAKISREELDQVLKRTKSGTRRAVRSEPELEGELSREAIRDLARALTNEAEAASDVAPEPVDPLSLPPIHSSPVAPAIAIAPVATPRRPAAREDKTRRLQVTPRMALVAALAVALVVLLAGLVGFFAGRGLPGPR